MKVAFLYTSWMFGCPRRESLAEDLRRLAEEKRRVRHEEAQEALAKCFHLRKETCPKSVLF